MAGAANDNQPTKRISGVTAFFMVLVAASIDGLQFVLAFVPGLDVVADFMLGALAAMIFGVWFAIVGVNYFSGKKAGQKIAALFGTSITELIPLLDALPALTIGVITIIVQTRAEDAGAGSTSPSKIRSLTQLRARRAAEREARIAAQIEARDAA